jgi:hypothetical protein
VRTPVDAHLMDGTVGVTDKPAYHTTGKERYFMAEFATHVIDS